MPHSTFCVATVAVLLGAASAPTIAAGPQRNAAVASSSKRATSSAIAVESLKPNADGHIGLVRRGGTYTISTNFAPAGEVWLANERITLIIDGELHAPVRTYHDWDNRGIFGRTPSPRNCKIRGTGKIVTEGRPCIYGRRSGGLAIEGLTLESNGPDVGCVRFRSGRITMRDVLCLGKLTKVVNRHWTPALVSGDRLDMDSCVLLGGQVGSKGGGRIRNCFYSQAGLDTNPFAHIAREREDFVFEDNVFVPINGRGILIERPKPGRAEFVVRNCVGLAREQPSEEYGGRLTASCVKTRYGVHRNRIENNSFLGLSGGRYVGGVAVWMRHNAKARSTVANNWLGAVLLAEPKSPFQEAVALGWSKAGDSTQPVRDVINHNTLVSNHHTVSAAVDSDAWNNFVHVTITDNVIRTDRDGTAIYREWRTRLDAKLRNLPCYARAKAQIDSIIEQLDAEITPQLNHQAATACDIWADGTVWQSGIDLTVKGSGKVSVLQNTFTRLDGSQPWPVRVTVIP